MKRIIEIRKKNKQNKQTKLVEVKMCVPALLVPWLEGIFVSSHIFDLGKSHVQHSPGYRVESIIVAGIAKDHNEIPRQS